MIRYFVVAIGIVTAVSAPALYAATRHGPAAQQADTIICPLTGEEIQPCCCPLGGAK